NLMMFGRLSPAFGAAVRGALPLVLVSALLTTACNKRPPLPPQGEPVPTFLVLAGEIKRATMHDFYRRPWPRDAAGFNPFRAGLVRLANHERLYAERHPDAVAMLRGECLLFLRDYAEAAGEFQRTIAMATSLRQVAEERRAVCLD